jgi:hypothetical protein
MDRAGATGCDAAAEFGAGQAQLLEQLASLRRSLIELNNQIEALRAEQAQARL